MTAIDDATKPSRWGRWRVPLALVLLSVIPVLGAGIRVGELSGGAEVTPANARFFASPIPVLVHVVSATLYCLLGAFQFVPSLRRRSSGWHRRAGRILVPVGLAAAFSGLWMTAFYPRPVGDGDLLAAFRLVFGSAMAASIILGLAAIRRRDFARHRAWMIRGYAIGQGAGTQALLFIVLLPIIGTPTDLGRTLVLGAAWVLNLGVAEWILRRRPTPVAPFPATARAIRTSAS